MFININLENIFDNPKESQPESSIIKSNHNTRSPLDFFNISESYDDEQENSQQDHSVEQNFQYNFNKSDLFSSQKSQPSFKEQEKEIVQNQTLRYKAPGERLYYQSKSSQIRKMKQLEKLKYQIATEQKKHLTFAPQINKKSQKMIQKREDNTQRLFHKNQQKLNKIKHQIEELEKKKTYEELKQCTFKPKIAKKTQIITRNRSDNVFQNLYKESKIKQIKNQIKQSIVDEQNSIQKQRPQQAINNFLDRNQQFLKKHKKKQLMLEQKAQLYDLSSGQRLFTPRIHSKNQKFDLAKHSIHNKTSLKNLNSKLQQKIESSKMNQSLMTNSDKVLIKEKSKSEIIQQLKQINEVHNNKVQDFDIQNQIENNNDYQQQKQQTE